MTPTDINNLLAKLNRSAGTANSDFSDTEKAYLLQQLTSKKKYGLIWEDKPEAVEQQLLDHLPVLTEVVERRVTGAGLPDDTGSPGDSNLSVFERVSGLTGSGRPSATPNG